MTAEQAGKIIEEIHAAPPLAVVAAAGAGSQAVAWLLGVAGASRTLLEVVVPYGRLSMIDFVGREPDQFVSEENARDMASAAYRRALDLREDRQPVLGLACTATIATDRTKRGDHRAFVAVWDQAGCSEYGLLLDKGLRDREGEEELVSRLIIQALAKASGVDDVLPLEVLGLVELTANDRLQYRRTDHPDPVSLLLEGAVSWVTAHPDGSLIPEEPWAGAILPGSFRPYHHGHRQLAKAAEEILGCPVAFELSVLNVDKPPLEAPEIRKRLSQFTGEAPVLLTRAETFHKKAGLFPGCTFVVGCDTAVRLVADRYYGNSYEEMARALAEIWAAGCRFLVAGREADGRYQTVADVPVPEGFGSLFQGIPESRFRVDISSTALRAHT